MNKVFAGLMLACCVSFGSSGAVASPPATAHASSGVPGVAAANRLLDAMGYEDLMRRTAESLLVPMKAQMKAQVEETLGAPVDNALIAEMGAVAGDFLKRHMVEEPKMREATALIYARHFTAAELDHMAILYRDPVMKRFNDEMPQALAEMMPLTNDLLQKHGPELEKRMKEVVQAYFDKHPPAASGS